VITVLVVLVGAPADFLLELQAATPKVAAVPRRNVRRESGRATAST
jgi:hypothetical protein